MPIEYFSAHREARENHFWGDFFSGVSFGLLVGTLLFISTIIY